MNIKTSENFLRTMAIMYVESDNIFLSEVEKALKMKSNFVNCVDSAKNAKLLLDKINIDILITAINLKDSSGIDLISYAKEQYPNIQIIVISSVLDTNVLLKAIKLNLIDYITKPINLSQLRDALKVASTNIFNNGSFEINFSNNIKYNFRKKQLSDCKNNINITHNEIALLDALILNQHCILSMDSLKDLVWENGYDVTDIAFKSLLSRLRTKIGKESIQNISGSGYLLNIKT